MCACVVCVCMCGTCNCTLLLFLCVLCSPASFLTAVSVCSSSPRFDVCHAYPSSWRINVVISMYSRTQSVYFFPRFASRKRTCFRTAIPLAESSPACVYPVSRLTPPHVRGSRLCALRSANPLLLLFLLRTPPLHSPKHFREQKNVPIGSYFSMLSGWCTRGRCIVR
jgi:hypothetical protein